MTRRPFPIRPRRGTAAVAGLLALAGLLGAPRGAHAVDGREPCEPRPAADGVASDAPDALSLSLATGHSVAVANWDARRWQRHRVWITLAATNPGDAAATILPDVALDLRRDGAAAGGQRGPALALAPHAGAAQRLAFYVPDDTKTLAVRAFAAGGAADVRVALSVECSERRFDAGEMAPPAAALLDEALKRYFAESIDPLSNPRAAFELVQLRASGAQDAGDVAWAVRALMQATADARDAVRLSGETAPAAPVPAPGEASLALQPDGTAVLRLRGTAPPDAAKATAWAGALHGRIRTMQAHHPRAWAVDLREFAGPTAWAALAALSPLLEGPAVGASVTRQGRVDWIVERGAAGLAGAAPEIDLRLDPEPGFAGPVAVLIGPGTADAGESVAVAFAGRAHTRFFGAPTAGFPNSGMREEMLSDGTVLRIAVRRDADRAGLVQRGPVTPDVPADDAPLPAPAVDWLLDEHVGATSRP